jgi:3'-phosphoadenosine 5'-phosphosulfate sulfotransferase (PAPS reductase)/FAD synthetase
MKRFISFSGGVESTTMCLLYGKGATAIWCDTGAEHGEMYERINKVEDYLKDFHNGEFNLIKIGGGNCIKVNYTLV